jgi:localization factor PodJL
MKSGVPWNIRGIDEETREAARLAARRSGQSVAEWLNRTIAERAAELGIDTSDEDEAAPPPLDETGDLARALDRMTRRIRAMDETSRSALSGLEERLDEIERHLVDLPRLSAGTGERARSLRGVSAMVADLSRDLDDVDERARRRVEGLREQPRSAGPGLDGVADAIRSLDRRIASMSEQMRNPADTELDEVRRRLDTLLAKAPQLAPRAPEPAPRPSTAALDATLRSLETRIEEAKSRLMRRQAPAPSPAPEVEDRARRIEARLADLNRQFVRDAAPAFAAPRPPAPPARNDLMGAIEEISARQRALDAVEEAANRRHDRSDDTLAAIRSDIAALADKIVAFGRGGAEDQGAVYDLARRIDALAADRPFERRLIASVQEDVRLLKAAIVGDTARAGLDERLALLIERTPDPHRLEALGEEVAAIRRAIDAADSVRATQRLEMRVAELGRSVEAAIATAGATRQREPEGFSRLESRLDEIAARVDEVVTRQRPDDTVVAIYDRLAVLADRIDELGQRQSEPVAALDRIRADLAELRGDIARREPPRVDHLEHQIGELAAKLDYTTKVSADADALAELEAQVANLSAELAHAVPRTDTLRHVEENLTNLQKLLSESRRDSIDAARAAARETLGEMAGASGDSELLRALKADLETIRAAASSSDRRTEDTLSSLHETLAGVVDRLSRLESDGEPLKATGTYGLPPAMPRSEASPAAMRAYGRLGEAFDDNRPLEPGSGKPDLAALREIARATAEPAERKQADRRADFIAAARRAAQAAAAETAVAEGMAMETGGEGEETEAEPARQSAFARIGQAIRSRRRPLLLAAAAIVLAIGAIQLFGDRPAAVRTATATAQPAAAKLAVAKPTASPAASPRPAREMPAQVAAPVAPPDPAGPGTPTVAKVSEPSLVPPAKDGRSLAFVAPEAVDSRFGAGPDAPPANAFVADEDADAVLAETRTASLAAGIPASSAAAPAGPRPDAAIGGARLVDAAASGDPAAAFEVAVRYAEGRGVSPDLGKAAEWYRRAAEGGVAVAQYRLGSLYERGQGVAKDLTAAVDWYQRAADQGNVGAMHNLAVLMSEGVDGEPNPEKALMWFRNAADYGVKDSQYNLGVIYARAIGVKQDLVESYKWFAVAASAGDKDAAGRRDDIAKLLSPDDLAKGRAAVAAWHAKPSLPEANAVAAPEGGWDGGSQSVSDADRRGLVMKIQNLLAAQGYDPGPADGVIGRKTRDAVRAFQRSIGVAETGAVDRDLVTALASQG